MKRHRRQRCSAPRSTSKLTADWEQGQLSAWVKESFPAACDDACASPTATLPDEEGTPA